MRLSCGQKPDKCRVSIEVVSTPRQRDVQTQPTQHQDVNIIKMLEVTTNSTIMLFTVIVLALGRIISSNLPWTRLPNLGICFPFIGHLHKFLTKEMVDDPIEAYVTCTRSTKGTA